MIKQRIMPTEIPEVNKFLKWGRTTRVIFTVKICIFERSNEKYHFSKTKIYFQKKKNYTTIIRTYLATKYESRRENEFWATCHNISNLFDGYWHPLLNRSYDNFYNRCCWNLNFKKTWWTETKIAFRTNHYLVLKLY